MRRKLRAAGIETPGGLSVASFGFYWLSAAGIVGCKYSSSPLIVAVPSSCRSYGCLYW